jgi:hypothetical protein
LQSSIYGKLRLGCISSRLSGVGIVYISPAGRIHTLHSVPQQYAQNEHSHLNRHISAHLIYLIFVPGSTYFQHPIRNIKEIAFIKTLSASTESILPAEPFRLPTNRAPMQTPSWISTRRVNPLQIVSFPGGGASYAPDSRKAEPV